MVKRSEIPLILFMAFTLVYTTIGDPDNPIWSGLYFIVNYLTLLMLFKDHDSKPIRLTGISLSISILLFIVAKYFLDLTIPRYYTAIPFAICLIGFIKFEMKK